MLFHDLILQGNASCGTFFLSDCDSRAIGRLNESGVDQLSISLPKLGEARMHEMEAAFWIIGKKLDPRIRWTDRVQSVSNQF